MMYFVFLHIDKGYIFCLVQGHGEFMAAWYRVEEIKAVKYKEVPDQKKKVCFPDRGDGTVIYA